MSFPEYIIHISDLRRSEGFFKLDTFLLKSDAPGKGTEFCAHDGHSAIPILELLVTMLHLYNVR